MDPNAARMRQAQKQLAADWNKKHRVGTPVRYWLSDKQVAADGESVTGTGSAVLGGRAGVFVKGVAHFVPLEMLEPIEPEQKS
jgi:hypothetical protein